MSPPLKNTFCWTEFHRSCVNSLAFAPDGSVFAAAGSDGMICLFETTSGAPTHAIMLDSQIQPMVVSWSASDRLLIGSSDGSVCIIETKKQVRQSCFSYQTLTASIVLCLYKRLATVLLSRAGFPLGLFCAPGSDHSGLWQHM